jgi:hypothetical protein
MSAQDNLSGIQFSHRIESDVSHPYHSINAHDEDRKVGELNWSTRTGKILRVEVQGPMGPDGTANGGSYRGRGIATAMYEMAKEMPGKGPYHSNDRTTSGTGWAKHVGGRLPRNVGH